MLKAIQLSGLKLHPFFEAEEGLATVEWEAASPGKRKVKQRRAPAAPLFVAPRAVMPAAPIAVDITGGLIDSLTGVDMKDIHMLHDDELKELREFPDITENLDDLPGMLDWDLYGEQLTHEFWWGDDACWENDWWDSDWWHEIEDRDEDEGGDG